MANVSKMALAVLFCAGLTMSAAQFAVENVQMKTIVVPADAPYTVKFAGNVKKCGMKNKGKCLVKLECLN